MTKIERYIQLVDNFKIIKIKKDKAESVYFNFQLLSYLFFVTSICLTISTFFINTQTKFDPAKDLIGLNSVSLSYLTESYFLHLFFINATTIIVASIAFLLIFEIYNAFFNNNDLGFKDHFKGFLSELKEHPKSLIIMFFFAMLIMSLCFAIYPVLVITVSILFPIFVFCLFRAIFSTVCFGKKEKMIASDYEKFKKEVYELKSDILKDETSVLELSNYGYKDARSCVKELIDYVIETNNLKDEEHEIKLLKTLIKDKQNNLILNE